MPAWFVKKFGNAILPQSRPERMTKGAHEVLMKFARALALVSLFLFCTAVGMAQNPKPINTPANPTDDTTQFAPLEEELRAKREIKFAEKQYQENLDRARDLSFLGSSLIASFKKKNSLDREDVKKLEKVEKLAKGIRHAAGGSEDDTEIEKPPTDLASALSMLAKLTESLKEKVEKTPKRVISAAVIDEANVLLELIRIVRTLSPKV